ncbi:MAG TPA: adenylate/guanylate cyclase domain-containing protein [Solirubrobacteraceae bacterium]|nr:adenylate/guanylate cyclase domain-containing protein [Solirubrobacteraceae bacterium]
MAEPAVRDLQGDPVDVAFFEQLMVRHLPRAFMRVMRRLPDEPRCRLCNAPYGGIGGGIMRRFGFGPSRKNPTLCNTCFERAPMGGVDMEIGVLFADVRGFTALSERTPTAEVARLLNRFYGAASAVLTRSALIDKFIGDEVMALYLPQLMREHWEDELVRDANDLLTSVGYGTSSGPWLKLGVGLDIGRAYVGNVGAGEVKDFTAVGDVVNTAARLQSVAGGGQIVLSERLFERLASRPGNAIATTLGLRGKQDAQPARVIDLGAATTV